MTDYDVICLSHLRWDFVFQRPQHLMTRCARDRRVFFFEEPEWRDDLSSPTLVVSERATNVYVAVPQLPPSLRDAPDPPVRRLLDELLALFAVERCVLWYYTPMAFGFSDHLSPLAVVYDCMDELSAFMLAPEQLLDREAALFATASVVFTGGQSLYEVKRKRHRNVHAFPSSVDVKHFRAARKMQPEPADQAAIPRPRFGFFGVLDERLDVELLEGIARLRPEWHFPIIGPVVKIEPEILPRAPNIHYLGRKRYEELPAYLAGWDAALLLFARNRSTRFISPTKTPEYLAGGRPVVSTSIHDVVRPYEELGLVHIADEPHAFVSAVEEALSQDRDVLLEKADAFLALTSWDHTWRRMSALVDDCLDPTACEPLREKHALRRRREGVTEHV